MERNVGLDFLKTIGSLMVICIHAPFPGIAGDIITPLMRIAVPLFFMITGYYYSFTKERKKEKKQLFKILRLFVGANLLFFIWSLISAFVSNESPVTYIGNTFSVKSVLKFIVLNESPFSSHLWYLGAILYVLLIVFFFEKKWDRKKLYPLVPFLLLVDIVFGKYSLLLFGREIPYVLVRNFLFVGMPYFLLGDMLYARQISIKPKKALLLSFVFALTTLGERFLLGMLHVNAVRDHYISTTFLVIFVFLFALQCNKKHENRIYHTVCYIGAQLSSGIYILHPVFITVIAKLIKYFPHDEYVISIYQYIAPIVVFSVTAVVVWGLNLLSKKIKLPKQNRTNC